MTTYALRHRQRDDKWVIYSGGTPIRKFPTRRAAARRARELAKPGDSLTVHNMDGSVSRQYDEPRA